MDYKVNTGPILREGDVVEAHFTERKEICVIEKVNSDGTYDIGIKRFSHRNDIKCRIGYIENNQDTNVADLDENLVTSPKQEGLASSKLRLTIATQIMSGLLASGKEKHPVKRAVQLTDALMEELSK